MSYSASSSYGPPPLPGSDRNDPPRSDSGSFRGGRNDSFRGGGGRGSFHHRDDRGRGGESRYQPREQQQQQGAPPLPPPDNDSRSGPPGRPDSARASGNSRPQYSRYGTLITDSGGPSSGNSYQYSRGGGGRGGMVRNNSTPFQSVHGPPRPMMFVPPAHMNGGPRPMAMAPMMPHAGGPPGGPGGRGGHPVIGGLHVQLARGSPVMGGPMQIVHPQAFQAAPQQPPLPATPSSATPLPAGWSEHYTPQGLQYFFDAATGVSTYERPTAVSAAADSSSSGARDNGGGSEAGEGKWIEYKDDASGQLYYYHTTTRETVWEQPEEFRIQQARDEVERMKKVAEEQAAAEAQAEEAKKRQEEEQRAKIYDHLSREERVALFKEFLEQKEISPQLKWQDAQRFIAKEGLGKDPRWKFALTSAGEKKQSFAEYCTQAINKQSIEKRRQVKKNREDFLELLAHFESLFEPGSFAKSEVQKKKISISAIELEDVAENPHFYAVRQDARWLVIEDQKEKKSLFNGFMQDVERKHDQRVAKQKETMKKLFTELVRKKADANEILLRGKRRLDSSLKTQLWDLLQELGSSSATTQEDHNNVEGLKNVEKYDVYNWSEELLTLFRDEEYEQRKRERELWREREAQLLKELEEKLRAMVGRAELTASKQWDQVRDLLSPVDGGEGRTEESPDEADEKPSEQQQAEEQKLSERAQMRVFEKIVKELRLALQPTVDVVSAYLSKASKGIGSGFEVHEAWTYEAFADALTEGIKVCVEEKKPEDGEEEDVDMDGGSTGDSTAADGEKAKDRAAAARTLAVAQKQHIQDELETLVKNFLESESEGSSSLEFPHYVRVVYDLLVTLAKEKKAAAAVVPTANLPSSSDKDSNSRSVRSTSRSRKRRRDEDPSRSISRSRSRPRLQVRSRSRSPRSSRSRSRSKPLDRSVVWNTPSSSTSRFIYDPLNGDDEDMTLPKKPKTAPLTAEEESARAEEIIRQARLKLQAKQDAKKRQQDAADAKAAAADANANVEDESELEEGEEPEEGEEEEEE